MSVFAKSLALGSVTRSDAQVVSMAFEGARPQPGDVVKLTSTGKVQVTTTASDAAYGVVTAYANDGVCAVVTHGHVLAKLSQPQVGGTSFVYLRVVRQMPAIDASGAQTQGYEVEV